jgi:hypothetical protein
VTARQHVLTRTFRTYYSSHTAWAQFLEDMGRRVRLEDFEQVLDLITPAAAA